MKWGKFTKNKHNVGVVGGFMKRDWNAIVFGACIVMIVLIIFIVWSVQGQVQLEAVKEIESGGDPRAVGSSGERGLYQIMPITLREYNNHHQRDFTSEDLFDPGINYKIAKWYIKIRIPEMLKHYDKRVTVKNILWAYNAGISNVVDGAMPQSTRDYINKYFSLVNGG